MFAVLAELQSKLRRQDGLPVLRRACCPQVCHETFLASTPASHVYCAYTTLVALAETCCYSSSRTRWQTWTPSVSATASEPHDMHGSFDNGLVPRQDDSDRKAKVPACFHCIHTRLHMRTCARALQREVFCEEIDSSFGGLFRNYMD
jgi:hypothetical protein